MTKKKYVFISNIASPYQVKFCYALQEYFNSEFWFYEHLDDERPKWWKIPLGNKCKILKWSGKLPFVGYFSFGLFTELVRFKPDIVVLGGFMKWHLIVLKVLKLFSKKTKVIVMTEAFRYVKHDDDQSDELLTKENSPYLLKITKILFNNVDLYLGMGQTATKQLEQEFCFPQHKVDRGTYPKDIDDYFQHPLRIKTNNDHIKLLFANRLVDRYNPLFMLEVFQKLKEKYPKIELFMNSDGSLKEECISFIKSAGLNGVNFLDKITSWNDLHLVYRETDILVLPATYSNGNLTIQEAKASGMGLVLSNKINDIEKNEINNRNCFICDLVLEEFVEGIEKYIRNPEILVSHGKLSRKLVENSRNANVAKYYYYQLQKHGLVD